MKVITTVVVSSMSNDQVSLSTHPRCIQCNEQKILHTSCVTIPRHCSRKWSPLATIPLQSNWSLLAATEHFMRKMIT